ncbi:gamma carbonic anhydrase family protein [Metabacillus herbersteinensis]|uniref:Gamma carbonic anhydrase family protein n=1 Tax=Metabacillus herbersteinensis TaxID=283816 RepID=A0ABV6GLS2_9BACI
MLHEFNGIMPQLHSSVYVAPGAQLIGQIIADENATIWFNAVLRGDNETIKIGKGSNIQDGSVIHVDEGFPVIIEENVTVGHNVILHGCTVKKGALIGMGATVLNGAIIGEGALVAAGAVVGEGKVVEPWTLVAGVPAKPIKKLSEDNVARMEDGAKHYVKKGQQFSQQNIKQHV